MSKERKNCMCTAMLYDPADHSEPEETKEDFKKNSKIYEHLMQIRQSRLLRFLQRKQDNGGNVLAKALLSIFQFLS